jgi:hypothetical protein
VTTAVWLYVRARVYGCLWSMKLSPLLLTVLVAMLRRPADLLLAVFALVVQAC